MSNESSVINVFIIVYDFSGTKTYSDELVSYLCRKENVSVHQIFLRDFHYNEFTIKKDRDVTSIHVPKMIFKEASHKYDKCISLLLYNYFGHLQNVIFHTNMGEQSELAKEIKNIFECPLVFTLHYLLNFCSYLEKQEISTSNEIDNEKFLFQTINTLFDHIICVTNFSQRVLMRYSDIRPDKITVIHNGKESSCEIKDIYSTNVKKRHYGFDDTDLLILYAGHLSSRKGIDGLIEAFLLVNNEIPNTKLIIAGQGEYDNYMMLGQKKIGKIHFVGKLDKKKLDDFYDFCDIGVLPSRYEQCSYVAIEMIQHKLPLIISDVPGLNELVIHKKTGLVCKVKSSKIFTSTLEVDVTDLSLQIQYLLQNKEEALKFAEMALINNLFSIEKMGEKTLAIYKDLINRKILVPKVLIRKRQFK